MTQPLRRQRPALSWSRASEPYASAALLLDRDAFVERYAGDYLCFVSDGEGGQDESFATIDGKALADPGQFLNLVPLLKRPGANPFTMMITIGRAANNDIRVQTGDVSKFHAYLSRSGEGWAITDAGSTNGTFVDGSRLKPRVATPLEPGGELALASIEVKLLPAEEVFHLLQPQQA